MTNTTVGIVDTPSSRLLRAVVYGYFTALAGGLVSFLAGLPGYNVSVLAIAVGWLVGTAVAKGSDRRGGWFYRTLAVGLTYLAVGASLSPGLYAQMLMIRPGMDLHGLGDMQRFNRSKPLLHISEKDRGVDAAVSALLLPWVAIPIDGFRNPLSGLAYVTALCVAGYRSRRGVQ